MEDVCSAIRTGTTKTPGPEYPAMKPMLERPGSPSPREIMKGKGLL